MTTDATDATDTTDTTADENTTPEQLRAVLVAHGRSGQRVAVDASDREGRPLLVVGFVGSVSLDRLVIERTGGTWSTFPLDRVRRVAPVIKGKRS